MSLNRKSGDKSLFQTTIVMLAPGSIKHENLSGFLQEALYNEFTTTCSSGVTGSRCSITWPHFTGMRFA
jgi:hypothetical protein